MPRTGRPPKPIEVKRRLGNPGKRRLANPITALAPVVRIEPVARSLTGTEFVQSILDAGASAWVGTTDQLGLLNLLAEAWDERRVIRAAVMDGAPYRRELRDLEKQITTWLSLLGLTPTDRSRLGVAEVKVRTKLEELRLRRESRAGRPAS